MLLHNYIIMVQCDYFHFTVTPYSYTTRHVFGIQLIKHIGCYGKETGLLKCSYSLQTEGSGSTCEDVAVHCIPGKLYTYVLFFNRCACAGGLVSLGVHTQ